MAFKNFIALTTLFFNVAFATNPLCAAVCECQESEEEGFVKLDCSRVFLSIVPPVDDWPSNITHMDLSSNNITELDVELSHDSLEVLDLSHNRINKVVQIAFGGLSNLKYLNLANNDIKHFEEDGFYGLDHLKSLNLSSNGLSVLPDKLFYHFIGLQELSLADNPLIHLDPIHFNRMINLRWLDLSNIEAYSFPPNIFHTTGQLEFLDISANDFHDVPTDALRSARNLKHLILNENPIDVLNKKSFIKLNSLEVLELSFMENLKHVDEETFSDLESLRVLEMKYNRHLVYIHPLAFSGLFNVSRPVLQELDLEGNQLRNLHKETVSCARMRKFNLQKNPWYCDCTMKWIKGCQIQKVYSADLKCSNPGRVAVRLISNLSEDDFKCEYLDSEVAVKMLHHDRIVRSVSVGLGVTFLVILAFGIALVFKWRDIKEWYRSNQKGTGAVYYVRARANPSEI